MKKIIAMLLALTVVLSFAACGTTTPTEPQVELPGSALEILQNVWDKMEEKPFAMGGGYENMTDNAPGALTATDVSALQFQLLVPEAEVSKVTEAASVIHAMNANTFTAGAFKVADAAAFAEMMKTTIQGNQWMCGFPEQLLIYTFGNEYVVIAFGAMDLINGFKAGMSAAYADAKVAVDEPLM